MVDGKDFLNGKDWLVYRKGVRSINRTKLNQASLVLFWCRSGLVLIWLKPYQIKMRLDLGLACLGFGLKRFDLIGALAWV